MSNYKNVFNLSLIVVNECCMKSFRSASCQRLTVLRARELDAVLRARELDAVLRAKELDAVYSATSSTRAS